MKHSPAHRLIALLALGCGTPTLALAHVGAGSASGLMAGLQHPLGGLDHLCAMLAVGLWAAQLGRHARWGVPLSFVGVMGLGSALGFLGIALPFVEQGIAVSVLLLGLLIAAAVRLPLAAAVALVGAFALYHGHAHGSEMPADVSGLTYATGFMLATALLHGAGIGLGLSLQRIARPSFIRHAGGLIALCGGYLWFA